MATRFSQGPRADRLQAAMIASRAERPAAELGAYDGTLDHAEYAEVHGWTRPAVHATPWTDNRPAAEVSHAELTPDQDARPLAPSSAKQWLQAGHAIFTLQGRTARYTYKISKVVPEDGSRYTSPAYFINLLTGPDNTADYTYIGMLTEAGTIRLTRGSKLPADSLPCKALSWALRYLWEGKPLPEGASIYHEGRCGRCGRRLTVPSSIESGYGPDCAGKLGE
jgi:hypothetical protein